MIRHEEVDKLFKKIVDRLVRAGVDRVNARLQARFVLGQDHLADDVDRLNSGPSPIDQLFEGQK